MSEFTRNQIALSGASINALRAFDAIRDPEFANIPKAAKIAWAMTATIHCDICRLVVALDECRQPGLARLLWMSDISSKLYEAKEWYLQKGSKLLIELASNNSSGAEPVQRILKELKTLHQISRINKYAIYRNKVGYHYDPDALDVIEQFGAESAEEYFEILKAFVRYSGEWAAVTKQVIQDYLPTQRLP